MNDLYINNDTMTDDNILHEDFDLFDTDDEDMSFYYNDLDEYFRFGGLYE